MKILHSSDWHLGTRLENYSRLEEQKDVLMEICKIAERENVNAVIISGDLFDNYNPPTEAVDLFYRILKSLADNGRRAVIAIAGNHDSPDRIEAPDPLARECGIIFAGYPCSIVKPFELDTGLKILNNEEGFIELQLPSLKTPLRLLFTPYANEYRLKTFLGYEDTEAELQKVLMQKWCSLAEKYCDNRGVNILAAHLFMMKRGGEVPEEPEDEKPIHFVKGVQEVFSENVPSEIQYVALGHLHRKQVIDTHLCPVVYSGSPLAYSFSEAGQKKYITLVEAEVGQPAQIRDIELTKGKTLLRKRFEDLDEAICWLKANPETLVELTMFSETYLTSEERKRLLNSHEGIIAIIPEVKNSETLNGNKSMIDLSKNIENLFVDYFKYKFNQEPNERIMNLFKEVLSVKDD